MHSVSVGKFCPRVLQAVFLMSHTCKHLGYDTLYWGLGPCFPDSAPSFHLQSCCILNQFRDQDILSKISTVSDQDFGPVLEHSIFIPRPWTKKKEIIQLIGNMRKEGKRWITTPFKVIFHQEKKKKKACPVSPIALWTPWR